MNKIVTLVGATIVTGTIALVTTACQNELTTPVSSPTTTAASKISAKSALIAWQNDCGATITQTVNDDFTKITTAANTGNVLDVMADANSSMSDTQSAIACANKVPDAVLRNYLVSAFSYYEVGFKDTANDSFDTASTEFDQGTTYLQKATDRINSINGN